MKKIYFLGYLMLFVCLFTSCGKDDNFKYPAVQMEMLMANITDSGEIDNIYLDNGEAYRVSINKQKPLYDFKGTQIRAIAFLEINKEEQEAIIHSIAPIPIIIPEKVGGVLDLPRDPVSVQRSWVSGNFLNIELGIKSKNLNLHKLLFAEFVSVTNEGKLCFNIDFYHSVEDDVEAFTQRYFLSIPLSNYGSLSDGEAFQLKFSINTDKGLLDYIFNIIP